MLSMLLLETLPFRVARIQSDLHLLQTLLLETLLHLHPSFGSFVPPLRLAVLLLSALLSWNRTAWLCIWELGSNVFCACCSRSAASAFKLFSWLCKLPKVSRSSFVAVEHAVAVVAGNT